MSNSTPRPADEDRPRKQKRVAGRAIMSLVEGRIRNARAAGAFDNLPGAGKPIPDVDGNYEEFWWLKKLLKREDLEILPQTAGSRETEDPHPSERIRSPGKRGASQRADPIDQRAGLVRAFVCALGAGRR